jgi:DNA invertase Pin-like site-specific DNA recombinase
MQQNPLDAVARYGPAAYGRKYPVGHDAPAMASLVSTYCQQAETGIPYLGNGQSLEAHLAELKAAGCEKVFQEKISGKSRDRAQLERALKTLGEGDVLTVTRLDRLARSSRDLLNLVAQIIDDGGSFKTLKEATTCIIR